MQRYQDSIILSTGQAVVGASVQVLTYPAGAVATIYSDNGSTVTTNPLITDGNGHFAFYAADARYSLVITKVGISPITVSDILLEDPADGSAALSASGGAALVGFLPSGSGAVARTLQAKGRDIVSVKDFGALGDGSTDDAAAAQLAVNATKGASIGTAKTLYWPGGGIYRISNLSISGYLKWLGDGSGTLLKAIAGGSATYMIASLQYTTAGQTSADNPFVIEDMWFDGNSLKTYAFVCRAFYPIWNQVNIYGGTTADLYISSAGSDGTQSTGTMVNGQLNGCTIGNDGAATGSYNILVNDPNFKVTDWQINGGHIRSASVANIDVPNCAGWSARGVHFTIGAGLNHWQIKRADAVFTCANNMFDGGNVEITNGNAGQPTVVFGPGNQLNAGNLLATFGANGSIIISLSNKYALGQIQHNLNSSAMTLISIADSFNNATPLLKNFSGGVMKSFGSYNANTGKFLQEGGSWTPTITFGGASVGITYTTQTGGYTKIEDTVIAWGQITLSNKGSSVGTAQISGLPFTILNTADQNGAASVPGYWSLTGLTGVPILLGQVNTANITVQQYAAASPTVLTDANFGNASQITFTFTYRASQANVVS